MSARLVLLAAFLALPLCAQQVTPQQVTPQPVIPRPSPFPEKNRERDLAAAAAEKAALRSVGVTRRARAKTPAASGPSVTSGTVPSATGKASFFTSSADGALTASGVPPDAGELVAAHATYPLGSLVKVTNLANGKTVAVQIIDRFPDSRRIINVSEEAARQLGFIRAGTADVRVELADRDAAPHPIGDESTPSGQATDPLRECPGCDGHGH